MYLYRPKGGESIDSTAKIMVVLANERNQFIEAVFSGTALIAKPGDTPESIVEYYQTVRRPDGESFADEAGGSTKVRIDAKKRQIVFSDRVFTCHSCDGTRLYQGFAEPIDGAVECTTCLGTGVVNYVPLPYSNTTGSSEIPDHIRWVYSPLGEMPRRRISIKEWLKGNKP